MYVYKGFASNLTKLELHCKDVRLPMSVSGCPKLVARSPERLADDNEQKMFIQTSEAGYNFCHIFILFLLKKI